MIRSTIARVVRGILTVVSDRVGKDGLFEQPGERPPTPPMAAPPSPTTVPKPALAPTTAASAPGEARVKPAPGRAGQAARPTDGCVPVDLAGLASALAPFGRPLVVNHWATWCDPCVDELPRLVRASAGLGGTADFIGVSWDLFDHPGVPAKVAAKVASFAASSGVGFASVLFTGRPDELFRACGLDVELVPQTLVLAPNGTVTWHKKGMLTDDDVFPLIAAVKAAAGSGS